MANTSVKFKPRRQMTSAPRAAPEPTDELYRGGEVHPLTKRLNMNLPKHVFDELVKLAKQSGRTMTEVVRFALGLAAIALAEEANGNRMVITNSNGQVLREIVLPK